jgi:autotransporter-associated beta strand protein
LVLTAGDQNNYSGPTVVDAGILQGDIASGALRLNNPGSTYDGADGSGTPTARKIGDLTGADGTFIRNTNGLIVAGSGEFAGSIDGSNAALTMDGDSSDVLFLTGNNVYIGATTVESGTLKGNIAETALFVNGSATYDGTGVSRTIGDLNGDDANAKIINVNGAGLIVTGGGVFKGNLDDSNTALTVGGTSQTLTLSGANTYGATVVTATTVVAGETLKIDGMLGGKDGNVYTHHGAFTNAGVLEFANADGTLTQEITGAITGGGDLVKDGDSTLTLQSAVAQDEITLSGGRMNLGATAVVDGAFVMAEGTALGLMAQSSATAPTLQADTATIFDDTALYITGYSDGDSLPRVLIETAHGITGHENLTYYVNGQTLSSDDPGTTPDKFMDVFGYLDGTQLLLKSGLIWNQTYDAHGTFNVRCTEPVCYGQTDWFTLDGILADNVTMRDKFDAGITEGNTHGWDGRTLTKTGQGKLTLLGLNTYSGGTTFDEGTIVAGSDTALGVGKVTVTMTGNTAEITLGFAGEGDRTLANDFTLDGNVIFDTEVEPGSIKNATLGGKIDGNGGVTKAGAGSLTLSGANEYQGGTTIRGGTLVAGSDTALGDRDGAVTMEVGTTLGFLGANRALANDFTLNGDAIFDTEIVEGEGKDATLSGWISGDGGLTKKGLGSLTLSYAIGEGNTYGGPTRIEAGTLKGNITRGTNLFIEDGATYNGAIDALNTPVAREIDELTGDGHIQYTAGLTVKSGTFGGDIDATNIGDLIKVGAAGDILTLTGTGNEYRGDTTINGGTLKGNIKSGTDLFIETGATYDGATVGTTGEARILGALTGSGHIINTANADNIDGLTVASGSFSGVIGATNTGGLTKIGEGTLTLSGTSDYSGLTRITGGTLAGNIKSSTDLKLENSATYDGKGAARVIGDLCGSVGTSIIDTAGLTVASGDFVGRIGSSNTDLTQIGSGVLILSGHGNAYTGTTLISAGTFVPGDGIAGQRQRQDLHP